MARAARWTAIAAVGLGLVATAAYAVAEDGDDAPKVTWADEFDGAAGRGPGPDWAPQRGAGGWGNNELQTYTADPANVALDGDGHLRITARRAPDGTFTSARLESRVAFTTGVISARIKAPAGQGLWPAFWTLGQGHEQIGWPRAGEIDMMELVNDAKTLHANVHVADPRSGGQWQSQGSTSVPTTLAGSWHVYAVRWSRDRLIFTLDGVEYHRVERATVLKAGARWPFDRPQVLLLNLAVGGNWPGPPDAFTPFPADLLVDWVRVEPIDG